MSLLRSDERLSGGALNAALANELGKLIAAVERLTFRSVRTLLSGTDEDGGSSIEAFILEPEPAAADPRTLD